MNKGFIIAVAVVVALVLLLLIVWGSTTYIMTRSNPLRRSEEKILSEMLELTPIGMHMDDVIKLIENEGWKIHFLNYSSGFRVPGTYDNIIGKKSIVATMGMYKTGLSLFTVERYVQVYWAFDEDSKLIHMLIHKQGVGL